MGYLPNSLIGGVSDFPAGGILHAMARKPYRTAKRTYPNRIREWRVLRGYSIEEFADRVGTKRATLHRHETGENEMTLAALERYARELGVKVEELLRDSARIDDETRAVAEALAKLDAGERRRAIAILEAATRPPMPAQDPAAPTPLVPLPLRRNNQR